MPDLFDGLHRIAVQADNDWRVELPAELFPRGGDYVMIPYHENTLAIARPCMAASTIDSLLSELLGGYDPADKRHETVRRWMFGNAFELSADDFPFICIPVTLRGRVSDRGNLHLLVQLEAGEDGAAPAAFIGNFISPVEGGCRVILPNGFSSRLGGSPSVFPSLSKESLWVMAGEAELHAYVDRIFASKFGGYDDGDRAHAAARRKIVGSARASHLDGGALAIPEGIARDSPLGENAAIVGAGDHVEIMPLCSWEETCTIAELMVV